MKRPETANKELTYYEIIIFYPGKKGVHIDTVYKTVTTARKRASKILETAPHNTEINIREETVFSRGYNHEISTNSLYETIIKKWR